MSVLSDLEPKSVFGYFAALIKIPRCSGNEKRVSDFLVEFAQEHNLEWVQEECLNVIIRKPATVGYENAPVVILQAHMDMVCVKREDLDFNFAEDPIPVVIDGDIIKTAGTTLGADNGLGMAIILAILASDLPHPPLVALFTVSEETGLEGAQALDPNNVSGDILINIDGEGEGIFLASAAGGVTSKLSLPLKHGGKDPKKIARQIKIEGLLGGHSGVDIDRGRGNAIKLLGRVLEGLTSLPGFDLVEIGGGEAMNVIPTTATATVLIPAREEDELAKIIAVYNKTFATEFATSDPSIKVKIGDGTEDCLPLADLSKRQVIDLLLLLPSGVYTMSQEIPGLVESSSNVGVVAQGDSTLVFANGVRSSVKSRKKEIAKQIHRLGDLVGGAVAFSADYPEWSYRLHSPIRDLMIKTYKEMFNAEPEVSAIHGGLECGFLQKKVGDIDMVAVGPDITGAHSYHETVSISSVQKLYKFICGVLAELS